jgi:hypothetical protein
MSTRVPAERVVWSTRASARAPIVTADFLITATALPPAWPLWSPSINRTAKAALDEPSRDQSLVDQAKAG